MSVYAFASEVNSFFIGESLTPKNCYELWDVLFKWGHVDLLLRTFECENPSKVLLKEMLSHIASRTLLFGKPFEFITNSEFSCENEELLLFVSGPRERAASKGFDELHKAGLLVSFWNYTRRCRGVGLDFYNIVVTLYSRIKKCGASCHLRILKAKSILKGLIRSRPFIFVSRMMQKLCGVVLPRNTSMIPEKLRSMGISSSQIADIVGARASKFQKKQEAKAVDRIADSSKVVIRDKEAKAFFINWKKLIVDSGAYPGYSPSDELPTINILAKVKSFLRAEYSDGKSWEDLKADLEFVIKAWRQIPLKKRRLTGTSKNGKPYSVDLKGVPDFVTYYEHRASIRQLCREYGGELVPTIVEAVVSNRIRNPEVAPVGTKSAIKI